MKALFLTALITAATATAHAEKIYCTFTEPFLTVTYNSDLNTIRVESPDQGSAEAPARVTFLRGGILKVEADGISQWLEVNLSKEGSDGMSDFIYPFEGSISRQLFGGCETDHLKKYLPTNPPPKPLK